MTFCAALPDFCVLSMKWLCCNYSCCFDFALPVDGTAQLVAVIQLPVCWHILPSW